MGAVWEWTAMSSGADSKPQEIVSKKSEFSRSFSHENAHTLNSDNSHMHLEEDQLDVTQLST